MKLQIVDLPADPAKQRGLNAWMARQLRARRMRILRQIHWSLRRNRALAETIVHRLDAAYREAAQNYYRSAP
jgi:hypothetical protein